MLGVVHDFAQTSLVGEEQMGTFIGGETAAETDDESVGVELFDEFHHSRRVTLILQPSLAELFLDIIEQFMLQRHARSPDFIVGHVVDGFPNLRIRLVGHEFLVEIFGIDLAPLGSRPSREVNAVGDVAHVVFLGEITFPNRREHFLRHPSVEFRHAIDLLTRVAGEGGHAEFLVFVVWIRATHSDEFVPRDAEFLRVATHIFAEKTLFKIVVTGGNGRVNRVKTTGTHQFECLIERQTFFDVVAQTLQVAECGVSFVAVIDVLLDAESLEQQHSADAEQNLLFQTIFPVAAIERVRDGTVEFRVEFVVGVKQIERHTTDIHAPNVGVDEVVRVRHVDNERIAVFVELALDRHRVEVLRLVVGDLFTIHRQALFEVAETIHKTDSTHIDVRVAGLFHVVASQHSQTARIDFQGRVHTVFHTEIGHRGAFTVGFHVHIGAEQLVNAIDALHQCLVLDDFLHAVEAQTLEQLHGVVLHIVIEAGVEVAKQVAGLEVPHPPEVVGNFIQAFQLLWKTRFYRQFPPLGNVCVVSFDFVHFVKNILLLKF